jgi:hypothetical protein
LAQEIKLFSVRLVAGVFYQVKPASNQPRKPKINPDKMNLLNEVRY